MAIDIEWNEPVGFVVGGTYHGPDDVVENVFQPSVEAFKKFSVKPDRIIDAGETVVVLGAFRATTPDGDRIESSFAHVYNFEDGKVTRMTNYTDTALWQ